MLMGKSKSIKANVEIYLEHPVGVGEHGDVTEAIQGELDKIAKFDDQINVINKYFSPRSKEFLGE